MRLNIPCADRGTRGGRARRHRVPLIRLGLACALLLLTGCPHPTAEPAIECGREDAMAVTLVSGRGPAQDTCTSLSKARGGTLIPAVPDGVIHQEIVRLPEKGEGGFRVYADGRYESKPMGRPWSLLRTYPPGYVEDLRRLHARAGLGRLAPEYRAAQPTRREGRMLFVQVRGTDARIRTIVVHDGCKVPELHALSARLLELHRRF